MYLTIHYFQIHFFFLILCCDGKIFAFLISMFSFLHSMIRHLIIFLKSSSTLFLLNLLILTMMKISMNIVKLLHVAEGYYTLTVRVLSITTALLFFLIVNANIST